MTKRLHKIKRQNNPGPKKGAGRGRMRKVCPGGYCINERGVPNLNYEIIRHRALIRAEQEAT